MSGILRIGAFRLEEYGSLSDLCMPLACRTVFVCYSSVVARKVCLFEVKPFICSVWMKCLRCRMSHNEWSVQRGRLLRSALASIMPESRNNNVLAVGHPYPLMQRTGFHLSLTRECICCRNTWHRWHRFAMCSSTQKNLKSPRDFLLSETVCYLHAVPDPGKVLPPPLFEQSI